MKQNDGQLSHLSCAVARAPCWRLGQRCCRCETAGTDAIKLSTPIYGLVGDSLTRKEGPDQLLVAAAVPETETEAKAPAKATPQDSVSSLSGSRGSRRSNPCSFPLTTSVHHSAWLSTKTLASSLRVHSSPTLPRRTRRMKTMSMRPRSSSGRGGALEKEDLGKGGTRETYGRHISRNIPPPAQLYIFRMYERLFKAEFAASVRSARQHEAYRTCCCA